jgi:serine/threonine protein kinase
LKPENILLTFDPRAGKCLDLKLCDFGLSTKFKPKQILSDFCGSPGFFAPEMIILGCYNGDKADVWSLGCILMELIMGHEKFCDVWMTAYDYDILQDKEQFTSTIAETVEHLPDFLNFSSELNDFVMRFLELRSSRRPSVRTLASHPWLEGFLAEELSAFTLAKSLSNQGAALGTSPSSSFLLDGDVPSKMRFVSREIIDAAYSNVSDKERKQMEEYYQQHKTDNAQDEVMHLPPITPATPSINKAKKILRKGNELANTNYGINQGQLPSSNLNTPGLSINSSEKSANMYDQYPYLSMTPETMSPAPSAKQNFLSPGRSLLPSVAESHEGSQDPYEAQQHLLATAQHSPLPNQYKPSLTMSQSDGKIWQGSAGFSSKGVE